MIQKYKHYITAYLIVSMSALLLSSLIWVTCMFVQWRTFGPFEWTHNIPSWENEDRGIMVFTYLCYVGLKIICINTLTKHLKQKG